MKLSNLLFGILLVAFLASPVALLAQNGGGNGNGNGNGDPEPVEEVREDETIPAAREFRTPPETEPEAPSVPVNINVKDVEYRSGVLPFLVFWQNNMIFPENEVPWHDDVRRHLGVNQDEFHRVGFARLNDKWIPVFFLRRFQMMSNNYNHILVIMGRPESIPVTKGMEVGPLGTEVVNEGFEVFMPTIASVSRRQKAVDEKDALDLVTFQLEQYGFRDIIWFADRSRVPGNVASGWSVE